MIKKTSLKVAQYATLNHFNDPLAMPICNMPSPPCGQRKILLVSWGLGVFNLIFGLIDEISIASIRLASQLLDLIQKNYIETFIRIESFSNSGKF